MLRSVTERPDCALLRRYVDASPLSKNEIGRRIGVTGTTIGNYMRGSDTKGSPTPVSARRLAQLADVLRISADELRSAGRSDAADALAEIGLIKGGEIISRLEKLRDELDRIIADSRGL